MGNASILIIPLLSLFTLSAVLFASFRFRSYVRPKKTDARMDPPRYIRYGRRSVYALSLLWFLCVYLYIVYTIPALGYAVALLVRFYSLTALFLLYAVLTPGLVAVFFPGFRGNGLLHHLRRALGVSVFFFALAHAVLAFLTNLSGTVSSVLFLSARNQTALAFSSTALVILFLLAVTSFDSVKKMLGRRWKQLHRFVYAASLLVVFHAFLIGSHFTDPTGTLPILINYLSLTYIFLEVAATVKRRLSIDPDFTSKKSIPLWILLAAAVCIGISGSIAGVTSKYDPHAAHRKGYSKNYRLTVSTSPEKIEENKPVTLTFRITDVRTGKRLEKYQTVMEKLLHVVVLSKDLLSYDHIHPQYDGTGTFTISHVFPKAGTYYLYAEYSPPDFYENMSVATIIAGSPVIEKSSDLTDMNTEKLFNNTKVTLSYKKPLRVNDTVDFTFQLTRQDTGVPIADIEPYLSAFGHMSAVSEDMKTYAHVHPVTGVLTPESRGGPDVTFSTFFPKSGRYKLFTQFKRSGTVLVTDFSVEVK